MGAEKKSKTILLVEDDMALQHAIGTKLRFYGFEVLAARSIEDADKLLKANEVQAIWLDHYLMGSKNGLEYAAELKTEGSPHKKIPVFVVSNTASPEKVEAYIDIGVDRYYTKTDYRLEEIIEDIQKFIGFSDK